MPPTAPPSPGWRKVPLLVVGLTALLVAMLTAFALPAINSGPHKVPIAVAGPGPAADRIADRIAEAKPGAFRITKVADADAARERIDDRDAYGAVVLGPKPGAKPEVYVATTAGPSVAATLRLLALSLDPAAAGAGAPVRDLHPPTSDDPNAVGLSAGALPLVLGGYLAAAAIVLLLRSPAQRAVTALGFALLGGFSLTALLQYGFGITDGNYFLISLAVAFSTAATSVTIMGLHAVLGGRGLGLGAAMMIFLGNPLSGLASGPEWLPSGWGTFGQFLPPGAGGTLLRSTAFFDGAGCGRALVVLACWLLAGLALFTLGSRRTPTPPIAPTPTPTHPENRSPVPTK
ncbi:hypothetical protein [Streptomyces caatingaensis]|uniref:Integral membrane protein n=1 Tax=Streptomyces caatingaensis TaxID=1678637 RepID=A0A0K9XMP7_9ACTN|nr:hypothetical protein [Streptomyces caatingaensis]KNB54376.1 hypothetical protein AC230_00370 [Streptomyces caatingaensis]